MKKVQKEICEENADLRELLYQHFSQQEIQERPGRSSSSKVCQLSKHSYGRLVLNVHDLVCDLRVCLCVYLSHLFMYYCIAVVIIN